MSRSTLRLLAAVLVLTATLACGDDEPTPTAPTPQDRPAVTETFSGTLTVNGAATHSFTTASGLMTVTLTTVAPDTATIGVSLGTWNGTACQIVIANDNAMQNAVVTGNAGTSGGFCARVYDVGRLEGAADYALTVVHF